MTGSAATVYHSTAYLPAVMGSGVIVAGSYFSEEPAFTRSRQYAFEFRRDDIEEFLRRAVERSETSRQVMRWGRWYRSTAPVDIALAVRLLYWQGGSSFRVVEGMLHA